MAGLLIVDGYNVIHALPVLRRWLDQGLQPAREALIGLVREWKARRSTWEVLIVYDGQQADPEAIRGLGESVPGIQCVFTSSGVDADEEIKQIVRSRNPKAETTVITGDREILACCRDHGVYFESPDFLVSKRKSRPRLPDSNKEAISDKERKEISGWYRAALKKRGTI